MGHLHAGRLQDKVVVVTGGASGIGRGVVDRCAAEGARIIVADISPRRDDVVADLNGAGYPALAVALDVRVAADHEKLVAHTCAHFGRLDVLVNCAGIFPRASLQDTTEEFWHRVMDINLTGVYLACRAIVPQMTAQGGGSIITIGSLHARRGSPELFAYAISKGGVVTLTLNLAHALARDHIRVNCVHPGWVMSEGEKQVRGLENSQQAAQYQDDIRYRLPSGRLQTPDDIANAVLFFASDESSQITGQVIAVDGGLGS